jgi:hypothetical protein
MKIATILRSSAVNISRSPEKTGSNPGRQVNYHPHSGWLGFSAIGRKDKSTLVHNVELATGCEASGLLQESREHSASRIEMTTPALSEKIRKKIVDCLQETISSPEDMEIEPPADGVQTTSDSAKPLRSGEPVGKGLK